MAAVKRSRRGGPATRCFEARRPRPPVDPPTRRRRVQCCSPARKGVGGSALSSGVHLAQRRHLVAIDRPDDRRRRRSPRDHFSDRAPSVVVSIRGLCYLAENSQEGGCRENEERAPYSAILFSHDCFHDWWHSISSWVN